MLSACHERVQRSLNLLTRLLAHIEAHGHSADTRSAAADVQRYFDLAAPRHHEDEELHLFPLLAQHPDAALRQATVRLQADHVQMADCWQALRPVLQQWQTQAPPPLDGAQRALVQRFCGLYDGHIALEESLAYPAAQALLPPEAQASMGQEMAARRKA